MTSCEILSNALLKSVAIASTSLPLSRAFKVRETNSVKFVVVDLALRKLCWFGEKSCLQLEYRDS